MRIAYCGNFEPAHSTENEVGSALLELGHEARFLQENHLGSWELAEKLLPDLDLILWTRTGWSWRDQGTTPEAADRMQRRLLDAAAAADVPTVAFHLDRWWGLQREREVYTEPFFRCSLVVTADGGHDPQWRSAGVNHHWLPPGVSAAECQPGLYRPEMASDVAFVGSWQSGYHTEWKHRPQLVHWLEHNMGSRCRFWPPAGKPAVRGASLRDLYASVKVLVGDSCLAGGATRYWSDRIPETLGRGGFLLHPYVEGIEEHFTDGEHLRLWELGNFAHLADLIAYYLEHDEERHRIAEAGRAHVLAEHTYTVRMRQVLDLVASNPRPLPIHEERMCPAVHPGHTHDEWFAWCAEALEVSA